MQGFNPRMAPQFYNDETGGVKEWDYVLHPAPVPAQLQLEGGRTCQRVLSTDTSTTSIAEYFYASTVQNWYFVFQGKGAACFIVVPCVPCVLAPTDIRLS